MSDRLVLATAAAALTDYALPLAHAADSSAPPATEAQPPIDFVRARALMQKRRAGEALTPEEEAYLRRAIEARRAGARRERRQRPPMPPQDTSHLKPLTEMTADDRYKGEDRGLYGNGNNVPPDSHRKAAEAEFSRIRPLDTDGHPAANGKVV